MLLVKQGGLFQLMVFEVHSPRLGGPTGSASGDHVLGGRVQVVQSTTWQEGA